MTKIPPESGSGADTTAPWQDIMQISCQFIDINKIKGLGIFPLPASDNM
jgi:hypothetical protein